MIRSCTLKIRGGVERDSLGKRAGKGALVQWERSGTIGVVQDQYLVVWRNDDDMGSSDERERRSLDH